MGPFRHHGLVVTATSELPIATPLVFLKIIDETCLHSQMSEHVNPRRALLRWHWEIKFHDETFQRFQLPRIGVYGRKITECFTSTFIFISREENRDLIFFSILLIIILKYF